MMEDSGGLTGAAALAQPHPNNDTKNPGVVDEEFPDAGTTEAVRIYRRAPPLTPFRVLLLSDLDGSLFYHKPFPP